MCIIIGGSSVNFWKIKINFLNFIEYLILSEFKT